MIVPLSIVSLLLISSAAAQVGPLKIRPTENFDVSGDGSAQAWNAVEWFSLSKPDGPLPYSTRVKMVYSETGIYSLFHCEDKQITSTLKEDFAQLWKEDVVEIFYWTDESAPVYFEYEISPHNYELAILVPNFNGDFLGWRPWQYEGNRKTRKATRILKNEKGDIVGWMAEVFIPYALLKPLRNVPPKKGTLWRMNLYRIDYDGESPTRWRWKPVKTNFHDYKSFGKIVFD